MKTINKNTLLAALEKFMLQRSGMDWRNYGDRASYMDDRRTITRQGQHAAKMIAFICRYDVPADYILEAARGGRLGISTKGGAVRIDYIPGQYFATEYRGMVCRVLADAIWRYFQEERKLETGDAIRKKARAYFGRAIASRWFN